MSKICPNCGYEEITGKKNFCPECGVPMIDYSDVPKADVEPDKSSLIKEFKTLKKDADERIKERNEMILKKKREQLLKYADSLEMDISTFGSLTNEEIQEKIDKELQSRFETAFIGVMPTGCGIDDDVYYLDDDDDDDDDETISIDD